MGRHKKIPDPNNMTAMQEAVFEYIKDCVLEKNYPPSVRDICKAVGLKSTSSVFGYINDLERMGLLQKDPSHPRALQIMTKEFRSRRELNLTQVPVLGRLSEEKVLLSEENIAGFFPMPQDALPSENVFMLPAKDDSMQNYGIFQGDKVILKQQSSCTNGEIAAVIIKGEEGSGLLLRRYYKDGGNVRLEAGNNAVGNRTIAFPDCKIHGKYIGLIRLRK